MIKNDESSACCRTARRHISNVAEPKINLLNYSPGKLEEFFSEREEKTFRAAQLLRWVHQLGNTDFSSMTNFSLTLREYLSSNCTITPPSPVKEQISIDGTKKWLLQLEDGNLIETVFIPEDNRGTLCISSQVGCSIGCSFCATGSMGFIRNLTVAEIIGQLWFAVHRLSPNDGIRSHVITNVVLMGMGEPLLNYDNVMEATELMLCQNGYGLSKYRITLSTCGITPQIIHLSKDSEISLAVSLHATDNELRNQLVPANKKYPLEELISVCDNYFKDRKRTVTIEYIMLNGINDSPAQAGQLVKLLSHGRYKVNLIPGNVTASTNLKTSSQKQLDEFRKILMDAGINTITRKSRGADIMAACGQLVAWRN